MSCSKCGADNREGRKFCAKCAAPLARLCSQCGASNEPGADFCGECASPLAQPTAASQKKSNNGPIRITDTTASENLEGERKTVTALFADIKGSTELMEDLDPEEARAIIDPVLKLMIDAVQRYDGYVVQSTGDGIFALFGAPVAHEDHPQRALYAALRMQEELKRYSDRMRQEGRLPLQARVGANTGEVVVRSIQTGALQTEYTPIGHTANLASRMQALAPIGSIAVTEATRGLCEGYFILKSLGPTRVKGLSEPVNVYEVMGLGPLRTRLQRAAGRGLTRFVGREHEMETLKRALEQTRAGRGQIVAVMAEPGIGKSRLFYEFKATSQFGWMVLETFSISHGKASAYLPVIDLLRNYFDISTLDDERKRREKVAGKIAMLDRSLEETLPYLFSLLGIVEGLDPLAQMDGPIKKRRTLEAIKRIVLRESLNQPLMVIFEDLHWIDEATQEFLNLLADSLGTAKILLLVNYRPEYSHQWNRKTYYTQLRLDPLGIESADEMLTALLGAGSDLLPLKRLIIERTGANPFFIEEIVQSLFEDGVLQRNGSVTLAKPVNAAKVPTTVQAVLAARVDRLPSDEKELLKTLAVLGREFPIALVRQVTLKPTDDLHRMLGQLQMAEFIYEQPAAGDTEYIFKHALTQEVAYNALLVERRKLLHDRAGLALESILADQLDDHLDELAHHYSRSDNLEKAVEYLGRAGQQAFQRSAYTEAIDRLTEAIDLLHKLPDSPQRVQRELVLQLAAGPALVVTKGGWAGLEVERAYNRARELCERLGDPPEVFPALLGLWAVHALREELSQAFVIADQLLRLAQVTADRALLMYAQYARGFTSFWMGEFLPARKHFETAIAGYEPQLHRQLAFLYGFDVGVHSLSYLALTLTELGYLDQALACSNEAFAIAHRTSNPVGLAFAAGAIGSVRQYRRETLAVVENAEMVIALSTRHGLTEVLPLVIAQRGWALAQQGRCNEGVSQIHEVLVGLRTTGASPLVLTYVLNLFVDACTRIESLDERQRTLREATAAAETLEGRSLEAETLRLKGELLLLQNGSNTAEAQSYFERAIAVARRQSAKILQLRATMRLACLLDKQGRRDEAHTMLAEIYNWFTEGFDTADLEDAKELLAQLAG